MLLPALQADADPDPIDAAERQQAVADLQSQIRTYLGDVDGSDEALTDSLRALNDVLGALTTGPESDPALQSFESALTSDIQAQLAFIRDALYAREV